jgi:hypothetical protein
MQTRQISVRILISRRRLALSFSTASMVLDECNPDSGRLRIFAADLLAFAGFNPCAAASPRDYPAQPVPFATVHLDDALRAPRPRPAVPSTFP